MGWMSLQFGFFCRVLNALELRSTGRSRRLERRAPDVAARGCDSDRDVVTIVEPPSSATYTTPSEHKRA